MAFLPAVPLQIPGLWKDISAAANSTDNSFHMLWGSGGSHMLTFSGTPFCCFLSGVLFQNLPPVQTLFFFVTVFLSQLLEEGSMKLLSLVVSILLIASAMMYHQ